jgi:hypothetical protein
MSNKDWTIGGHTVELPPGDTRVGNKDGIKDPGPGKHLWIMLSVFALADPTAITRPGAINLDHENLLTIEGPGCYKCEQEYKPGRENTWCRGSVQL